MADPSVSVVPATEWPSADVCKTMSVPYLPPGSKLLPVLLRAWLVREQDQHYFLAQRLLYVEGVNEPVSKWSVQNFLTASTNLRGLFDVEIFSTLLSADKKNELQGQVGQSLLSLAAEDKVTVKQFGEGIQFAAKLSRKRKASSAVDEDQDDREVVLLEQPQASVATQLAAPATTSASAPAVATEVEEGPRSSVRILYYIYIYFI